MNQFAPTLRTEQEDHRETRQLLYRLEREHETTKQALVSALVAVERLKARVIELEGDLEQRPMNDKDLQKLTDLRPCEEALEWYRSQPSMQEAWANCERGDWMIWALRRQKKLTKKNAVTIAIACASRVLKIYEDRNPGNSAPRKAIEAAQAYLDRPCAKTRQEARAAADADAAYAAADAAARKSERIEQAKIIRSIYLKFPG